jgi:hypothetical protein
MTRLLICTALALAVVAWEFFRCMEAGLAGHTHEL